MENRAHSIDIFSEGVYRIIPPCRRIIYAVMAGSRGSHWRNAMPQSEQQHQALQRLAACRKRAAAQG